MSDPTTRSTVTRRTFVLASMTLTGVGATAAGFVTMASATGDPATRSAWILKTDGWSSLRGHPARTHCRCSACVGHAAKKIFATRAAADDPTLRAHPGCLCEPAELLLPVDTWRALFGDAAGTGGPVVVASRSATDAPSGAGTTPVDEPTPTSPAPVSTTPTTSQPEPTPTDSSGVGPTSSASTPEPTRPTRPRPTEPAPASNSEAHAVAAQSSGTVSGLRPVVDRRNPAVAAVLGESMRAPAPLTTPRSSAGSSRAVRPDGRPGSPSGGRTDPAGTRADRLGAASSARSSVVPMQLSSSRPRPADHRDLEWVVLPLAAAATAFGALVLWRRRGAASTAHAQPDGVSPPTDG